MKKKRRATSQRGSLIDIMKCNSGASLFVRPICWSEIHAKALSVKFTELPPCTEPLPLNEPGTPPSKGHLRPSPTISELSTALSELLSPSSGHPVMVTSAIRTVLGTLWPDAFRKPKLLPEMHLFYGDKVYRDAVRAQLLWNYPDTIATSQCSFVTASTNVASSHDYMSQDTQPHNPVNLPMMCYMSKAQMASIRRNMFRVAHGPGKTLNEPVYRLQQLRSKSLCPANPDEDIHLAGIFLGMAQKHFYSTMTSKLRRDIYSSVFQKPQPRPKFTDLTLRILTHDSETSEFIVYTGHVSAKFLERFHYPHKAPKNEIGEVDGLRIDYTRVPIWPILGLRERLGQAFGEDVVGPFDPTVMETWNEEETEIPCSSSKNKRKREALSEVLNGSFDSEQEVGSSQTANNKRQRLQEGPLLGVVA